MPTVTSVTSQPLASWEKNVKMGVVLHLDQMSWNSSSLPHVLASNLLFCNHMTWIVKQHRQFGLETHKGSWHLIAFGMKTGESCKVIIVFLQREKWCF
jgi:hypothetical protein